MILIKYATRGRPELFKQTIVNILDTIETNDFKILVSADRDDITMSRYSFLNLLGETKTMFYYGDSANKIAAINRDMEHAGEWDVLINMSDDMKFVVNGWDKLLLQKIKETWGDSTDFFAHFNDGYTKALATMSIMGREYYDRFGYIYHPDYNSFSCDAEAYFVAQMLGRHHYFDDVLFKHQHPANTPEVKNDDTYRRNRDVTNRDVKVYFERMKNYFDVPASQRICVPFQDELNKLK